MAEKEERLAEGKVCLPNSLTMQSQVVEITERYLTESEVALITGRAVQTLRNDRHHNRGIPYHKFGRSVRYLGRDVTTYTRARRISTKDQQ